MPYLIALLIGLALIAAFPVLTLVLPRVFRVRVIGRLASLVESTQG